MATVAHLALAKLSEPTARMVLVTAFAVYIKNEQSDAGGLPAGPSPISAARRDTLEEASGGYGLAHDMASRVAW
jgi:hypothetical protein